MASSSRAAPFAQDAPGRFFFQQQHLHSQFSSCCSSPFEPAPPLGQARPPRRALRDGPRRRRRGAAEVRRRGGLRGRERGRERSGGSACGRGVKRRPPRPRGAGKKKTRRGRRGRGKAAVAATRPASGNAPLPFFSPRPTPRPTPRRSPFASPRLASSPPPPRPPEAPSIWWSWTSRWPGCCTP